MLVRLRSGSETVSLWLLLLVMYRLTIFLFVIYLILALFVGFPSPLSPRVPFFISSKFFSVYKILTLFQRICSHFLTFYDFIITANKMQLFLVIYF